MPAFANITVNNHAAAAVTYYTEDIRNGVVKWNDTAQGTAAGFRPISLELRRATDRQNGVDRVIVKVARPVVNGTTGAVDYTSRVNIEGIIPVRATLAEKQELYAAFKNFAAHTNCQKAMVEGEGTY
jgi:hypothetical protein